MSRHGERLESSLHKLTAEFINRESAGDSLITVTDFNLSPDGKNATAIISVLPVDRTETAVAFCERRRNDLLDYIRTHLRVGNLPHITFTAQI